MWVLLEKRVTAFLVAEITKTVTISCTCGVGEPSFAVSGGHNYIVCIRVTYTTVIEKLYVDEQIILFMLIFITMDSMNNRA